MKNKSEALITANEPFIHKSFHPNIGDIVHVWKTVGIRYTIKCGFQTSEKLDNQDIIAELTPDLDLLIVEKIDSSKFFVKIIVDNDHLDSDIIIKVHMNHLNPNTRYNKMKLKHK